MMPSTTRFEGADNRGAQVGTNTGTIIFQCQHDPLRSPPPPSDIIPFRRDRDFVERDILTDLCHRASDPAARIGLVGLGGVGKTQLAIEYAHRVREADPKRWVFWVHASSAARFEESYKQIAERVRLTGWNEPKADILGMVRGWLSDVNSGRWTMVVDNADSTDVMFKPRDGGARAPLLGTTISPSTGYSLSDYLPSSANGSMIITSRSRKVTEGLIEYAEDILDVGPMAPEEAISLLTRKLKRQDGNSIVEADLTDLVQRLDYIPLAITQAASCINQRAPRITVSKYLKVLEGSDEERAKLLLVDIRDPRRDGQASNSVITTWYISFDYLRHTRTSATCLLALMSLFDREGIPDHLLRDGYLDDQSDEIDFEEDIATLMAYSLISIGLTKDVFKMHRLVQFSTKKWLEVHNELTGWQERYVDILGAAFPTGDFINWPTCQVLFPHVEATKGYQLTSEEHLLMWATIQYRGAWFALKMGRYGVSERMARSSFEAREGVLGLNHARTLDSIESVAVALRCQGKYEKAEEMNRRALAGSEKELGVDHPDTLTSVSNLASVLQDRGKYEEAEEMNRRALAGYEKDLGVDHPDTLTSVGNLASVLQDRGKYEEAEEMNRRALAGYEKELGVDHPDTLTSVGNLASVLQDRGKYEEAEEMNRRALAGSEKELGVDHPSTLASVYWLAYLLDRLRNYNEALGFYDRAVAGYDRVLGPTHPTSLACQKHRASLLEKLSRS